MARWALASLFVAASTAVFLAVHSDAQQGRAQSASSIVVPGLAADSVVQAVPTPEAAAWVDFLAIYTLEATGAGKVTSSVAGRAPIYSGEFREVTGTVQPGAPVLSLLNCTASNTPLGTAPLRTYKLNLPIDARDISTMEVIIEPPTYRFTLTITCPDLPGPRPLPQDTFAYWYAIHSGQSHPEGGYRVGGFSAPTTPGCILARTHQAVAKVVEEGVVHEDLSIAVIDRADCPVLHDIGVE